jgi:hypothetical protein
MGSGGSAVDAMVIGRLGVDRRAERFFSYLAIFCFFFYTPRREDGGKLRNATIARRERARREGAESQLCGEAHRGGDLCVRVEVRERAGVCARESSQAEVRCESTLRVEVRERAGVRERARRRKCVVRAHLGGGHWCGGEGDYARKCAG